MPSLTIKKLPDELYQRLKESAARNRRSLNNEAITLLERHLLRERCHEEEPQHQSRERIGELRERAPKGNVLTDEEIDLGTRDGGK